MTSLAKQILGIALVVAAAGSQTANAAEWEKMCEARVDREIASVYIQEVGVWRKKVGNNKYETRLGVKVWDIYKSCFILQEKANITLTARSSAGGHATAGIHWDPRANLKGGWRYKTFNNTYLKDCGGGFTYKVQSYCE